MYLNTPFANSCSTVSFDKKAKQEECERNDFILSGLPNFMTMERSEVFTFFSSNAYSITSNVPEPGSRTTKGKDLRSLMLISF
ncbi:hypothetical protein D3C86_1790750 [compost metagenome]